MCDLGTAPTQQESILGVLLRAMYNYILVIIHLLLRGGSTQGVIVDLVFFRFLALKGRRCEGTLQKGLLRPCKVGPKDFLTSNRY